MVISTVPDRSHASKSSSSSQLFTDLDRHRRTSPWRWCGCLFLLLILGIGGGLVTAVAATGIVDVPVVGLFAYPTPPQPARTVAPVPYDVAKKLTDAKVDPSGRVDLTLSEGELTSLVAADHWPMFRQSQLSIDPDGIHYFGYDVQPPFGHPIVVQASFVPATSPTDQCRITSAQVGRLPIPLWLAGSYTTQLCRPFVDLVSQSGAGQRTGVTLGNGSLTTHLQLAPPSAASSQH